MKAVNPFQFSIFRRDAPIAEEEFIIVRQRPIVLNLLFPFASILGVFLFCLIVFSLTGCDSKLPGSSPTPDANVSASESPTGEITNATNNTETKTPPATAEEGSSKNTSSEEDTADSLNPNESEAQAVERDLESRVRNLAMMGVDPFSISMPVDAIQVFDKDVTALSPYYQALVMASPLVSITEAPKKAVNPTVTAGGGVPVETGPSPEMLIQAALSSIQINGISYKRTAPMAILSLGGSSADSQSSTIFVKRGSRMVVDGLSVLVEDIRPSSVTVSSSYAGKKISQILWIQDIFGFARSGGNGSSSASASTSSGTDPSGKVNPDNVSTEQIDQIVQDLLK